MNEGENMILKKLFKWDLKKFFQATIGEILFCIGMNLFIVPMGLYTGGILGISQLIRTLLISIFNINISFDIAGLINFILNIPLFIIAYKKVSKTFFIRTVWCVTISTLFLSIIPVPTTPLVSEIITSTLVGAIIAGLGSGLVLTSSASGGGTEIIGIVLSLKNKNISVGKISLSVNLLIYIISGICFGLEIMIYSIIYTFFANLIVDQTHSQNISSSAMIFTKEEPHSVIQFIEQELRRGSTFWEAQGGFDDSKTYITYVSLSKYELQRLERHLKLIDPHAFMVKTQNLGVVGNYQKYL